jgi:tellurite resistance protein
MPQKVSPQTALIYVMVLVSAADSDMPDRELGAIGTIVKTLPAFSDFDPEDLVQIAEDCAAILAGKNGLEDVLKIVKSSLNSKFRETAYALACDVAATDGELPQEELRLLEMIRHTLQIDRLTAAAIERGAAARYARP